MRPYYEHRGITIYCGDSRDVLADIGCGRIVDLLLTDPPYGQQFAGGGLSTARANIRADGARQGVRVARQVLNAAMQNLKPDAHVLVFCHWESWPDFYDACSPLIPIKNALIWDKHRCGMGDTLMEYARDYEVILYGAGSGRPLAGRRDGAVIRGIPPCNNQREHPVEKPVRLMSYLIQRHAPASGVVLDPFAGVGPVLQAAKNLGRRAIGIEIEERYCEIAARRLAQDVLL